MRACPVCDTQDRFERTEVFSMSYKIPDGWPLPDEIIWYTCNKCGVLYGDGDFNQKMLNYYYKEYYGYGVNNPDNVRRLKYDARFQAVRYKLDGHSRVLDFGGAGDDSSSIFITELKKYFGLIDGYCTGAGDPLPADCDVIFASHVLEHIYDLPQTMKQIISALKPDGILVIDGPDSTGLLQRWKMPILDFNTKHLNHFTMRDILNLGYHYRMEMILAYQYELEFAPSLQVHLKFCDMPRQSAELVEDRVSERVELLKRIDYPVNVWGLSDVSWHLLSLVDLNVLDYIDNDPAYRGRTYAGKSVQERPTNDAPIVIMSQGQRQRLIANIRGMGIANEIVEI